MTPEERKLLNDVDHDLTEFCWIQDDVNKTQAEVNAQVLRRVQTLFSILIALIVLFAIVALNIYARLGVI